MADDDEIRCDACVDSGYVHGVRLTPDEERELGITPHPGTVSHRLVPCPNGCEPDHG